MVDAGRLDLERANLTYGVVLGEFVCFFEADESNEAAQ
jgi:hypothetical protein